MIAYGKCVQHVSMELSLKCLHTSKSEKISTNLAQGQRQQEKWKRTGTLSHLERKLQIFPSPNVKATVISAQLLKKALVDAEKPAGHGRAPDRLGRVLVPLPFTLGYGVPVELEVPVEAADGNAVRVPPVELERGVVDHVDDRAHHRRLVAGYAVQQWLQPAWMRK